MAAAVVGPRGGSQRSCRRDRPGVFWRGARPRTSWGLARCRRRPGRWPRRAPG